jgi:hypothetical protein
MHSTTPIDNFVESEFEEQRALDKDAAIIAGIIDACDPYLGLPACIQMTHSRAEYLWLSDADKATLVQRECDPEA